MTGDDSLALDSIASDYRFVLEHDTSMLEMALAAVSFEDCSLDDAVPLDRVVVAYDCWLEALEALHPGHRFRGFGLSDAELSDNGLLERLLLTVLFDGGSCRFIRSVVAVVNGYRRCVCRSVVLSLFCYWFGKCWMVSSAARMRTAIRPRA